MGGAACENLGDQFPDAQEEDADGKKATKATHSGLQRRPSALHDGGNDSAREKRGEGSGGGGGGGVGFALCRQKVNAKRQGRRRRNGQKCGGGVLSFLRV